MSIKDIFFRFRWAKNYVTIDKCNWCAFKGVWATPIREFDDEFVKQQEFRGDVQDRCKGRFR